MSDKVEEFSPGFGVITVIHRKAKVADVCSGNQLQAYLDNGWEVGYIEDLIKEDTYE